MTGVLVIDDERDPRDIAIEALQAAVKALELRVAALETPRRDMLDCVPPYGMEGPEPCT